MPRRPDLQAGFTLIEVLAALVITAALVGVVLPFAGRLIERWRAGQRTVEMADMWMQAIARLSDDFAEAVPIQSTRGGQSSLSFGADPRRVEFVRSSLGSTTGSGLESVIYSIVSSSTGDSLVRRSSAFVTEGSPGHNEGPADASTTIVDGAYRFRFAFAGKDGRRKEEWIGQKEIPARVDLTVQGLDGTRTVLDPIVLPITAHATADQLGTPIGP